MSAGEILLIDDDELLLNLAQQILQSDGYSVTITSDGPRGIELYVERHPDLVLLDLGLPTLNGLTVLSRIREYDTRAKIIVISGYSSEKSSRDAIDRGAIDFLTKPLRSDMLLKKVRTAMSP